jgi:hypothetical protein
VEQLTVLNSITHLGPNYTEKIVFWSVTW